MSTQEKPTHSVSNGSQTLHPSLRGLKLGIWRVAWEQGPSSRFKSPKTIFQELYVALKSDLDILSPFFKEVYNTISPRLLVTYFTAELWEGFWATAYLVFSNKVLKAIEISISTGHADRGDILTPLGAYVAVTVLFSCITWASARLGPLMEHKVRLHFDERLMEAHSRFDYETSQGNTLKQNIRTSELWTTFCEFLYVSKYLATAVTQFGFLLSLAHSRNEMYILVLLCLAKPLMSSMLERNLWIRPNVIYIHDKHYLRLRVLKRLLTESDYKEEVITGGLAQYLVQEFKSTLGSLTETVTTEPDSQYEVRETPLHNIITCLISDIPLHPSPCFNKPLGLRETFDDLYRAYEGWGRRVNRVKSLYEVLALENKQPEGTHVYPLRPEKRDGTEGMGIEFQNVSFGYPAEDDKEPRQAIRDVSFNILPSSLVVIVGTNGSGKTTVLKLLSCLYRPNSGSILIDGDPIETYKASSLHDSTAVLTQKHQLFPLAVSENIGIGDPLHAGDEERISEAATRGGAEGVIKKLKNGMNHLMEHDSALYTTQPLGSGHLFDFFNSLDRGTSVSGGEKQRLVASRTFMRITSDRIKLVMVDEPTSAMDPEGELHLFDGLRQMREGKTMIFVTHRFGHLTKHADHILCMKDGELVESGTHQSLIDLQGEYFKLYNIQAQAFTNTKTGTSSEEESVKGVEERDEP